MPSSHVLALRAGAIITGVSALVTPLPTAYAALAWVPAVAAMHLPSSERLTAWLPVLGHAASQWMIAHAYYPWTAWALTAQHLSLIGVAAGLSVIVGAITTLKIAHDNGSFSRFGGPSATGHGEHGTAHWRPMSGFGGIQDGYELWMPPKTKPSLKPAPTPTSLRWPRAETMLPPAVRTSPVADRIAEDYHHGIVPPAPPTVTRPPEPYRPSGLVVGLVREKPTQGAWVLSRDEHSLVIGSTGAGKTRRLILPTIGITGLARRESLLISDPKGEVYSHTAGWLRAQGYQIRRVDLIDPTRGHRFNPLIGVIDALQAGDWSTGPSIAQDIAQILVDGQPDSNQTSKDPFWPQTEMGLITAIILALAEWAPQPEAHLFSAFSVLAESPDGSQTDAWFADATRYPPGHAGKLAYSATQAAGKAEQTRAGIFTGAMGALRLFADPQIAWMTAESDHDLSAIGREPTATYLIVPWENPSRWSIAGLYLSLTIRALARLADHHGGKLPVPVHFLLDEFGNFPAIPGFASLITVARSLGIRFTLAVQALEQLQNKYPKAHETIRSNTSTWIFLKTQDDKTAQTLSGMMGEYTLSKSGTTMPKIDFFSTSVPGSATESTQLAGRALATKDEILRWPQSQSLILQAGFAPARLPLPDLSQWHPIFPEILQRHEDSVPPSQRPAAPPLWDLDAEGETTDTPRPTSHDFGGLFRA